jgi:hypothetical protein
MKEPNNRSKGSWIELLGIGFSILIIIMMLVGIFTAGARAATVERVHIPTTFVARYSNAHCSSSLGHFAPQEVSVVRHGHGAWRQIRIHGGRTAWVNLDYPMGNERVQLNHRFQGRTSRDLTTAHVATFSPQAVRVLQRQGAWIQFNSHRGALWTYTGVSYRWALWGDREINALARMMHGESNGLSRADVALTGWVALNRFVHGGYGRTIHGIITDRNQFHGYFSHFPLTYRCVAIEVLEAWSSGQRTPLLPPVNHTHNPLYFSAGWCSQIGRSRNFFRPTFR